MGFLLHSEKDVLVLHYCRQPGRRKQDGLKPALADRAVQADKHADKYAARPRQLSTHRLVT